MLRCFFSLLLVISFGQISYAVPSAFKFNKLERQKLKASGTKTITQVFHIYKKVALGDTLLRNSGWDMSGASEQWTFTNITLNKDNPSTPSSLVLLQDACTGQTITGWGTCDYLWKYTPTTIGNELIEVTEDIDENDNGFHFNLRYIFKYHINTFMPSPKKSMCDAGSIISVDSQTVAEDIPLVGVPFSIRYSTGFASSYTANSLPSQPYFHTDGLTFSIQHFYDSTTGTLYLGTGSQTAAPFQTLSTGNNLVVSSSGDEIYIFDSNGKHLETKTFLTGATKYLFGYDSGGRLINVTDAFGKQTTLNRDGSGVLTSIQGPYGQTTTISVSGGKLSSVTNPNSETYSFTYKSGTDLMATFTKPGGQASAFTYNSYGQLTKDEGAGGNFWSLIRDYNQDMTPIIKSSQMGRQSTYSVYKDDYYQRVETTPFGMENTYVEGVETKSYNNIGMYRTVSADDERFGAAYQRTTTSAAKMGGIESVTTFGQTVNFPTGVTDPFGFTSITKTATTNSRTSTSTYTASTKTQVETSHEGATATTVYNSYEQPVSQQTGSDTAWTFSYDTDGRLSQVTQGSKNTLNYAYNTAGYVQSVTDALSQVTSYLYDLAGRVTQVTLPDTRVISYNYDANGNLTSVTPPSRPAHGFTFNLFEVIDTYSPPALSGLTNKNTTYTYNLDKQLTKITRPDLQEVNYNYNSTTGQISSIQLPTGNYTYTFKTNEDRIDNISSPDDFNNKFGYYGYKIASDALRKTSTNFLYGMTSFTYDADHRLSSRSVRGNAATDTSTVNYTYNNDDQLVAVGDMSLAYEYPSGRLSTTSIGKIADARTYDAYGNLQTYTATYTPTGGSAQVLYSYTFTRDALNRIATKTETVQGTTDVYAYSYDSSGRLSQVLKNTALYSSYNYDSNGNRTSGTTAGTAFTATYDDQDRILSYNTRGYSYNANGDLTQIQWTSTTQSTYSYDSIGNLKQAVLTSGNNIAYSYDGLNRRALKLDGTTLKFRYLYEDGYKVSAQVNNSGQILKAYVYATSINVADYMIASGVTYRLIKDHLGSPRLVVNVADGTVIQRMDYNDLGEAVTDTNGGYQPFGYAGGLYDAQTKLVKFGARDYDARAAGRWTTKDPIRFAGRDSNFYGYSANDPINKFDPLGLATVIIITRGKSTGKSIPGTIDVFSTVTGEVFNGYSMENANPPNANLPAPAGVYSGYIRSDYSPNRIQLNDVPDADGVQIHNGSYPSDYVGCIGAGTKSLKDFLGGTKDAINKINKIIKKDGSGEIQIIIQ